MNKVIIKSIPIRHHSYYQWLILGLQQIEQQKQIKLKFRLPFYQFIYYFVLNDYLRRQFFRFISRYQLLLFETYNLEAVFVDEKNQQNKFVFDVADSPFSFESDSLKNAAVYFKVQCPKLIDEAGFRLTDEVFIPFPKEAIIYKNKIKPAMLGCRRLAWSVKYAALKMGYDHYISFQTENKQQLLTCYFGGATGPAAKTNIAQPVNFDDEGVIMGYFAGKLQHPNEKRYQLFKIIRQMGNQCDARVINKQGVVDDALFLTKDAPVPLKDFTSYIGGFKYNANVSGFRLSIPNRFIESFMVGTAIVTDQLSVKWYQNFEEELVELPEMGYLPNDKVNWDLIQEKLIHLKDVDALKVIKNYNRKWAPTALAKYVVSTLEFDLSKK